MPGMQQPSPLRGSDHNQTLKGEKAKDAASQFLGGPTAELLGLSPENASQSTTAAPIVASKPDPQGAMTGPPSLRDVGDGEVPRQ